MPGRCSAPPSIQPHFQSLRVQLDIHRQQLADLRDAERATVCIGARSIQIRKVAHDALVPLWIVRVIAGDRHHRVDLFMQVVRESKYFSGRRESFSSTSLRSWYIVLCATPAMINCWTYIKMELIMYRPSKISRTVAI